MKKEYLPSKKFISMIYILILALGIVFLISKLGPEIIDKTASRRSTNKLLVKELIKNDSNKNGIADWEESLFGLDPKADGEENKKIIEEKRKHLGGTDNKKLSKNDLLSREIFSIITSLQQTGNLNEAAIANITDALDQKISSEPITDIYSKKDIRTKLVSNETLKAYYERFGDLVLKYKDAEIGEELVYISQALLSEDKQIMSIAVEISDKYEAFGEDLMMIPNIPSSLAENHISMANNYHKTSVAIKRMSLMLDDPLVGMNAVVDYKNFVDGLVKNLGEIEDFLDKNVIIKR